MTDEDSSDVPAGWLDDVSPERARAVVERDPKFRDMLDINRKLTPSQRDFLLCYAECHYDPEPARKLYNERHGMNLTQRLLRRWITSDANFIRAVQLREEIAARAVGVSSANVLSVLKEIQRRNFLGKPARDEAGHLTGGTVTDDRLVLQATEMIGKHLKMFGRDEEKAAVKEGPALLIQINASPGAVNVTPTESNKRLVIDLPRPEKDLKR